MSEKRVGDWARPRHPYGDVLQLARRELQRTWLSYLRSGALNLLFGLLALSLVLESAVPGEAGSPETSVTAFPADLLLVVFLANLCTNWASRNHMQTGRDPFHEYLAFLRTLPVSAAETLYARVLVMLLSVAIMAWVFFAPSYALLVVFGPEVQEAPRWGLSEYLEFVGVWSGYSLLSAGALLYLELGLRGGGRKCWSLIAWSLLLVALVLWCNSLLGVSLVAASMGLVGEYGALPAAASLLAGSLGLWLAARIPNIRVNREGA